MNSDIEITIHLNFYWPVNFLSLHGLLKLLHLR